MVTARQRISVGARSPVQHQSHPAFADIYSQMYTGHGPTKRHQSVEGGYEVTAWRSVGGNRAGQEFASEEDCFESGEYIHEHFF